MLENTINQIKGIANKYNISFKKISSLMGIAFFIINSLSYIKELFYLNSHNIPTFFLDLNFEINIISITILTIAIGLVYAMWGIRLFIINKYREYIKEYTNPSIHNIISFHLFFIYYLLIYSFFNIKEPLLKFIFAIVILILITFLVLMFFLYLKIKKYNHSIHWLESIKYLLQLYKKILLYSIGLFILNTILFALIVFPYFLYVSNEIYKINIFEFMQGSLSVYIFVKFCEFFIFYIKKEHKIIVINSNPLNSVYWVSGSQLSLITNEKCCPNSNYSLENKKKLHIHKLKIDIIYSDQIKLPKNFKFKIEFILNPEKEETIYSKKEENSFNMKDVPIMIIQLFLMILMLFISDNSRTYYFLMHNNKKYIIIYSSKSTILTKEVTFYKNSNQESKTEVLIDSLVLFPSDSTELTFLSENKYFTNSEYKRQYSFTCPLEEH